MAQYKTLKKMVESATDELMVAKQQLLASENEIATLTDKAEAFEMDLRVAKLSELSLCRRADRAEKALKHPPSHKLISRNSRLQAEVNHLQRLINTRRR